jgi:2-polyprenyl-3-methyl-5-hydroxy-6-metoxy-1,4-benzoquinol methylase
MPRRTLSFGAFHSGGAAQLDLKALLRRLASTAWSGHTISDEGFRSRYLTIPHIVDEWTKAYRPLAGAAVLDFGCGEGIAALGLALNYSAKSVVGVDIMPDPERCLAVAQGQLEIRELPPNLRLHRVEPGRLHSNEEKFDIAYSWSVFEHVDQRLVPETLRLIASALRPGGLFLAQIDPLYYSAGGSHLLHKIDEPWAHLTMQQNLYRDRLERATSDPEEFRVLWSTYETLNRITAAELVEHISQAGFEILKKAASKDGPRPPARLKAIYQEEALVTNQIAVLARKRR